jgi:chromosome segregation ATPase
MNRQNGYPLAAMEAGRSSGVNPFYPAPETNLLKRIFHSKQVESVLAENYRLLGENQFLRKTEAETRNTLYSWQAAYNHIRNENFTLKGRRDAAEAEVRRGQQLLQLSSEKERHLSASLEIRSKQVEDWVRNADLVHEERKKMYNDLKITQKERNRLQTKVHQYEKDLDITAMKLKSVNLENETLKKEISQLQEQRKDVEEKRLALASEIANEERELVVMKEENVYLTNQLAALKVEHDHLQNDFPNLQMECQSLSEKLHNKESEVDAISSSRDTIRNRPFLLSNRKNRHFRS